MLHDGFTEQGKKVGADFSNSAVTLNDYLTNQLQYELLQGTKLLDECSHHGNNKKGNGRNKKK